MIHSASPDRRNEDACRMAAARLQHDHQRWMVMWGCYTCVYIAFPLFPAPRGTILTAAAPDEMTAKMRRQERAAGMRVPPPRPAPGRQYAPGRQQVPDWQGGRSLDRIH